MSENAASGPAVRHVTWLDVPDLVEQEIGSTGRTRPIVCVSRHKASPRPPVDADSLQRALGEVAEVWVLEDGRAAWALTENLPEGYDVFGDALRIWYPGATGPGDTADRHPRLLVRSPRHAGEVVRDVLARLGRAEAAESEPEASAPSDGYGDAEQPAERTAPLRRVHVNAGTDIEGTVLRLSVAGADVETPAGILLVPMREFGRGFVREPSDALAIGQTVRGVVQTGADGSPILSLAGHANDLLAEIAARGPGAIVMGRIHESRPGLVKVDVAAGVTGVIRLGRDARGPRAGSRLPVEVVAVNADEGRLELRLAAPDAEPGSPLRLYDGGPAFLEGAVVEGDAERIARLEDELDRVEAERDELLGEVNRLRARLGEDRGDRGPARSAGPREGGGDRPYRPREGGGERTFRPRESSGGDRPYRPREGGGGDRPYRPREGGGGGDRPYRPREGGGGDRPYRPREGGGGGDRPYQPREGGGGDRPYRPREGGGGDRPYQPREGGGGDRPYRPREGGGSGDRPYRPREGGGSNWRPGGGGGSDWRPQGDRPPRPQGDRPPRPQGDRPPRPQGDRPYRPRRDDQR